MIYDFVPKDPDKAYISNRLWLPKSGVRPAAVKSNLNFKVMGKSGRQETLALWQESRHHIIVPREFLPVESYANFDFPFVDIRPSFERVQFEDLVIPRNEEQWAAWRALQLNDNGILNLGCGKGKTKLFLKKVAQKGVPTLVVVPDAGILDQWKRSILGDPKRGTGPGLRFDGGLGIIDGDIFDWRHPLTLAKVTTLSARIRNGEVPEEMWRFFGLEGVDEAHFQGAPHFNLSIRDCYGDRIGLTATVEREDGLTAMYLYHLGRPFYVDLSQQLKPQVIFQQTPVRVDFERAVINGITNISKLRTIVGKDRVANAYRYWVIRQALAEGRKVLCISHSSAQLHLMHSLFPGAGLIVGNTPDDERVDILRASRICFAISKLGSTGADDESLDTVFWLTPFRSKIALQQSMGRIQRICAGKKDPKFVVFEDWLCSSLKNLCKELKGNFKDWNYQFTVNKPWDVPLDIPTELRSAYDEVYQRVRDLDDESGGESETPD